MKDRWAVRQKATGFYLPESTNRGGGGHSFREPVDCTSPQAVHSARLHATERAAKNALTSWLMGHFISGWDRDDGMHIERVDPQLHRKREDMEVVRVSLRVHENECLD